MRRLSTRSGGSPGTSPGQALDPAGGGSDYVPEGNDYKGGAGAEAGGRTPPPLYNVEFLHRPSRDSGSREKILRQKNSSETKCKQERDLVNTGGLYQVE